MLANLSEVGDPTKFSGEKIGVLLSEVLPYVFSISGIALLIFLMFSGFQYLTSGGDPKAIAQAQKNITYAMVGFIVVLASFWAVRLMGATLNLPVLTNIFS